jgi:hypothetical protein
MARGNEVHLDASSTAPSGRKTLKEKARFQGAGPWHCNIGESQ